MWSRQKKPLNTKTAKQSSNVIVRRRKKRNKREKKRILFSKYVETARPPDRDRPTQYDEYWLVNFRVRARQKFRKTLILRQWNYSEIDNVTNFSLHRFATSVYRCTAADFASRSNFLIRFPERKRPEGFPAKKFRLKL